MSTFLQVEMNVRLVGGVRSRAEHRRETRTSGRAPLFKKRLCAVRLLHVDNLAIDKL